MSNKIASKQSDNMQNLSSDKPKRYWLRSLWLIAVLTLIALLVLAIWLDSASGHRFIVKKINQTTTETGLGFQIDSITGSIYNDSRVKNLTLRDTEGDFFEAHNIAIEWFPFGFLGGRLSIDALVIETGELRRLPKLKEIDDDGPTLPGFDIFIGELNAQSIDVNKQIMGRQDIISITGNADIQSGRARIKFLLESLNGNDNADIDIDIEPDRDMFKLAAKIEAPKNGLIQTLSGIKWADNIIVSGRGGWSDWSGQLNASLLDDENINLNLDAKSGDYTVKGVLDEVVLPVGLLRKISTPTLNIDMRATYNDRRIYLDGSAISQNAALQLDGGYDLSIGGPDALLIDFDILKPESVAKNITGKSIAGRVRIDGPLSNMNIEHLLNADVLGLGAFQLENVNAKGQGKRLGKAVRLPVDLSADNAIGLDPQLLELMRDVQLNVIANLANNRLNIQSGFVKTNRITGTLDVDTNLRAREYDIVFDGKLPSYLVEGVGLADIDATLNFNPAQPKGLIISGDANAKITRMDNDFLRNLGGGLPIVDAKILLGPDAIFRFPSFTLDAPLISFKGSGQRLRDKSFIINGDGLHQKYGQAELSLLGDIARPNITLKLDRPLDSLGLRDVALTLTPDPKGFQFSGKGTSLLGPFVGDGKLVLPVNNDARVRFERLLVSDTIARGTIRNTEAGFAGDFFINQGGVDGMIKLRPVGSSQRVNADINIKNARFRGDNNILIRSGRFKLSGLFDGKTSDIDATLQAQGISQGNLILGRIAANAKIKNGNGEVTASIAGTRGSGFDVSAAIDVSPKRYVVRVNGNYGKKKIQLTRNAVITNKGQIWNLSPTRLAYGGGRLTASGRYGPDIIEFNALLDKLPLNLLDLGDRDLGFGGVASGNIQYSNNANSLRGKAELKVKDLNRAGLVLSSQPIDAAINMQLKRGDLAARAILSRKGKNVGRFQGKVDLANGSDVMRRIERGRLFAQGRFSGQAGTLWRLTGIELFDLTGDAKIALDARGSLLNPIVKGAVQTKNARLESGISGTVISKLNAKGRFDGSRLRLTQLEGDTPNGGAISGDGYFDFTNSNSIGIGLNLQATNALLIDRDDVAARVTGPIKISSTGDGGVISGNVIMNEGRYQLGKANAAEILPNLKVREINIRDDLPLINRNSTPWQLDIAAKVINRFDVKGLGIDSEWSGDFKIGGRIDNPTIGGRANLVRGDYDFAGRVFRLARGSIIFDERTPPNPQIDITAEALLNGVDARIEVRGRSLSPEVTFSSTPPLPQEELLARLLFGSSLLELSPAEAIQLSSAIAGLQSDGGLDPINTIRKAVGLDRLRFVSANAATGQGAGIAVGKFIGRRTFVELVTDGRGYSATQVEFQVTRWLALLSSISTIGEQGVNARVSRDY